MTASFDLRPEKILKRPNDSTNYAKRNEHNIICSAETHGGFYDLFDSKQETPKPSSKHLDPGYGFEKTWRSTRIKVPGAGVSNLGSDMISKQPEQWRPCIRYVDPGTGTWIYYQPWKPSRRYYNYTLNSSKYGVHDSKCTRRKYISQLERSPICVDWHPRKGRGTTLPKPQWKPLFRQDNIEDCLQHYEFHVQRHRENWDSKGVRNVFDSNCSPPTATMGRRRLPTYKNEQLSRGVGAALNYAGDYNTSVYL